MKRATDGDDWKHPYDIISIHALVKRATFFNDIINQAFGISIHALVKRATDWEANFPDMYDISIHALVKRATCCKNMAIQQAMDFNPRPREEGDCNCGLQ